MELMRSSGAASVFPVTHPATILADKIVAAVGNMPSAAFANSRTDVKLPFPALEVALVPQRFRLDEQEGWSYMDRKKLTELHNVVISLWGGFPRKIDLPPVRPDEYMLPIREGSLWGNMGSGKSYILAALVCELMSSFRKLSTTVVDGQNVQMQRVVYLPDCSELLDVDKRLVYIKSALMQGYADDGKTLAQIDGLRDEDDVYTFLEDEHKKGVFLYFIVNQENALDLGEGDEKQNSAARAALSCFALYGGILKGASANNENVKNLWYRKQTNIRKVFLYGGLSEEEYGQWKEHVKGSKKMAALVRLSEGEEQRIKFETGCLPLFLQCWNADISPEEAWKCFLALPEISYAHHQLTLQMDMQLRESNPSRRYLRAMYSGFVSGGEVIQGAEEYECQYLYTRESGDGYRIGECVCGIVKRILAEHLQNIERNLFLVEWQESITREGKKQHANPVILGFMVEQTIIAKALSKGIKLSEDTLVQMNRAGYFKTGSEGLLDLQKGWTLYIPSAFNYARVDAVVRGWFSEKKHLYEEERLHIAALQITLGNVQTHRKLEEQFWNPRVCDVWFESAVSENVVSTGISYGISERQNSRNQSSSHFLKLKFEV